MSKCVENQKVAWEVQPCLSRQHGLYLFYVIKKHKNHWWWYQLCVCPPVDHKEEPIKLSAYYMCKMFIYNMSSCSWCTILQHDVSYNSLFVSFIATSRIYAQSGTKTLLLHPDFIANSPHCHPHKCYAVSSENLVMD